MSEIAKPLEPVAAAPVTDIPATEPVVESKPEETATETPAVTEPATEEAVAPVVEDVKPVEEGILSYKAPGLIKYVHISSLNPYIHMQSSSKSHREARSCLAF